MSLSIDHQYRNNITTAILQAVIDQNIIREKLIASRLCKSFAIRSQLHIITKIVNGQLLKCSNQISVSNKQLVVTPIIIHYHCKPL